METIREIHKGPKCKDSVTVECPAPIGSSPVQSPPQNQDTSKREDYGSQRTRMPAVNEGLLALTTAPMKPQPYGCLNKIHTTTTVDMLAWMRDTSQGHTRR